MVNNRNFVTCLLFLSVWIGFAQDVIKADDSNIHIEGSNYIYKKGDELVLHRHSDKVYKGTTKENLFNPLKARTSSGILIKFKTNSPKIIAKFKIVKGNKSTSVFSIFQNGTFIENSSFKYEPDSEILINLESKYPGKDVVYKITFPLKTDIHFLGLELEDDYQLIEFESPNKPVYVACGNSITHGTGQKTTPETYAFQIAKKFGYELFNVAVGGGKTSQVMAEMIANDFKRIDVMTILIGFNDYNGQGIDIKTFYKRYDNMLKTLRSKHANTKIYCITMTYTNFKKSKTSGIPVDEFRGVITHIVEKMQLTGDKSIFLIKGEAITSKSNLKDNVHFTTQGAKDFADALFAQMK